MFWNIFNSRVVFVSKVHWCTNIHYSLSSLPKLWLSFKNSSPWAFSLWTLSWKLFPRGVICCTFRSFSSRFFHCKKKSFLKPLTWTIFVILRWKLTIIIKWSYFEIDHLFIIFYSTSYDFWFWRIFKLSFFVKAIVCIKLILLLKVFFTEVVSVVAWIFPFFLWFHMFLRWANILMNIWLFLYNDFVFWLYTFIILRIPIWFNIWTSFWLKLFC